MALFSAGSKGDMGGVESHGSRVAELQSAQCVSQLEGDERLTIWSKGKGTEKGQTTAEGDEGEQAPVDCATSHTGWWEGRFRLSFCPRHFSGKCLTELKTGLNRRSELLATPLREKNGYHREGENRRHLILSVAVKHARMHSQRQTVAQPLPGAT